MRKNGLYIAKQKNKIEHSAIDKSGLDIDRIRSVDNKQYDELYKNHELIDYILTQCSYTYINVIDSLQFDLGDLS